MGSTLLGIIGSLMVFFLGLLLYMVKSNHSDIKELEKHIDESLERMKLEIMEKVHRPDCIREMMEVKSDLKELVRDVRVIERGKVQ